jgi:hypothetical protein
MQSFIVLGIIPGTNIQTNLTFWIIVSLLVTLILCRTRLLSIRDRLQSYLVIRKMARAINHCEFQTLTY